MLSLRACHPGEPWARDIDPDCKDPEGLPARARAEVLRIKGVLLRYGGNFNTYVTSRELTKQEGLIFRHCLRLILLLEEFEQLTPPGIDPTDWKAELKEIADKLTETCRAVDPTSTEETIKKAHAADVVEGEEHAQAVSGTVPEQPPPAPEPEAEDAFGAGIVD